MTINSLRLDKIWLMLLSSFKRTKNKIWWFDRKLLKTCCNVSTELSKIFFEKDTYDTVLEV
jgi:hypothetical protein